ncbi:FAD-binding oxidoreductase [Mesorhizobium sp. M1A.F.Ca.IN.020.03.2.1]|nr:MULTISPECIES: FAD-binding oxidoreductase [unclassified Mesorhizobium]RUU95182.1 FAD-binding oxidoreductase [Mesorhizobium sp. M1A.F.Ca.IN.020.03.2.1]RWG87135.1 MAG: FAD-binding oxidoreductase [Mesorhizobium sp.]RWK18227.1 MAG: FAD-binding oxidoreductase [Mesorhizobium sp.]
MTVAAVAQDDPGHALSWYAATANDKQVRPSLQGSVSADVCIVGAGFTGISAALQLSEKGYKVVVLEAQRIGFGASGRNGGQIVNGYSRDLETIERRYGPEKARWLALMSREGGDIIRQRVQTYGIDCDLRHGGLFAAFTAKQVREFERIKAGCESYGLNGMEIVAPQDIDHYVKSKRYVGGMIDRMGGHIHPLNLVLGEAAAAEQLGARIVENSRVVRLSLRGKPIAATECGQVEAQYLLVCGNAYLAILCLRSRSA